MIESRRFVVKSLLGEGGFGSVYLADMVSSGGFRKEVALKVLNGAVTTNPEAAIRLRDEARLLGLLRHRNIVAVDDLVRFDEGWGVVMEYVPGVDLGVLVTDLVRKGELLPPRAAAEVCRGIARALEAAYGHARPNGEPLRAVHRDIKPGNVRITAEGEVKVLDFGIARAEFDAREAVTSDGRFGSLAYMSPERVMGDPDGPAGDIYALGIVLWEMLAARPRGRARLREAEHQDQVADMVQSISAHPELAALVAQLTAFHPSERPTAAEVGAQLRTLLPLLRGPDLETLARAAVPQILATSGPLPAPAIQELVPLTQAGLEDTHTTDFAGLGIPSSLTAVPAIDDVTGYSVAPAPEPLAVVDAPEPAPTLTAPPPSNRLWMGLAGLLAIGLVGGGVAWKRAAEDASAVRVPPAVVAPVPVAVPEPSTAPDPNPDPSPDSTGSAAPPETPPASVEPEPPVAPSTVEATPAATPSAEPKPPVASTPSPPVPVEPRPTEATPVEDAPRLRAVKFSASGATAIEARCAGVRGAGGTSALVRNVPAGPCEVRATVDGNTLTGTVVVDSPRLYACAIEGAGLTCR